MRQHLACVKAAQAITAAEISGAKVGSGAITFKPNGIKAGRYEFSVGTAGSTMLIFQTVLPALAQAQQPSQVMLHGGTHNMMAPSYDFIKVAFAPLLKCMGVSVDMQLHRHGFYPQGGGQWSATIQRSADAQALDLTQAGQLQSREAVVTLANIPGHVARRELETIAKHYDWQADEMRIETVQALGGGNMLSLRLHYQHCSEVIEHVGKIGLAAEKVAKAASKDLRRYQDSHAVVGEHLADQLLLPMVLGKGGVFRSMKPSLHCRTNRDIIEMFSQRKIRFSELNKDLWEVRIS
jgi:RNA 3'-terminal phosphate cyclase (ATP)